MHWRRTIDFTVPLIVSLALLTTVVAWVSPHALIDAAGELQWRLLLPLTAAMVLALYLCDAACLPLVYSTNSNHIDYVAALKLRGLSYLAGAFNYQLGQVGIAWGMARLQQASLLRMLSRTIVLAYHDAVILLMMGLAGSIMTNDSRVVRIQPFVIIALGVVLAAGLAFWNLPTKLRGRLQSGKLGLILTDWTIRKSLGLLPLRVCYFGTLVIYAAIALAIANIPVNHQVVLSTIPLVLLADGLPNFAGLGTRETALLLLLDPEAKASLLAMSLYWSSGMIMFRLLIGLAMLWCHSWSQ